MVIYRMREHDMSTDSGIAGPVRTIKASEFKAKCLKIMDEVAESGEEVVITKYGRPVSRLMPYREKPKSLFGRGKGMIEIHGDIVSPMPEEWFQDTEDSSEDLF